MEKDNISPSKDVKKVLLKVSKAFGIIPIATVKQKKQAEMLSISTAFRPNSLYM